MNEHVLYPIIDDILFSRHANIDIVMPYWNMKKQVGPKLAQLLTHFSIPRLASKPQEWIVATDQGPKRINFVMSSHPIGRCCTVIIPDDRKELM